MWVLSMPSGAFCTALTNWATVQFLTFIGDRTQSYMCAAAEHSILSALSLTTSARVHLHCDHRWKVPIPACAVAWNDSKVLSVSGVSIELTILHLFAEEPDRATSVCNGQLPCREFPRRSRGDSDVSWVETTIEWLAWCCEWGLRHWMVSGPMSFSTFSDVLWWSR